MSDTRLGRLQRLLASPRVVWIAIGLALLLNLPSVPTGWYLDDLVHRGQFLEVGPLTDGSDMTRRMYDFLSGDPEEIRAYKDLGVLPWWAEDRLRIRFFRPLSSITHVIDYALWPESGPAMHVHSLLWLALLVGMLGLFYRRMIAAPMVAGLAVVLYALDDAHGMPVAFLANRNAFIAAFFGVASLWLHDRYRRDSWKPGWNLSVPRALLSPLAFGLALAAGESGLGTAPYLFGYALFVERRRGPGRFVTILPHAAIGIAWLVAYQAAGYGTFGGGFYSDPLGEPGSWAPRFVVRAPILLLGQWFLPPSSFAFAWTPRQTIGVALAGAAFLGLLFLVLLRPILREDATARFLACGMLGSVVPITAAFPHDRLLFFVGIGAMGLLAMLLTRLFDRSQTGRGGRLFGWALVFVHVALAAPFQLVMSSSVARQEPIYAGPPRSLPDAPELEEQRLLVVNPPNAFYAQYTLLVRHLDGRPAPKSMLLMAPGLSDLLIERPSLDRLTVSAEAGWLGAPFDDVYRARDRRFPGGFRLELSDVSIRVAATTEDGRPQRVDFELAHELEHPSFRFVRYERGRYVPFELPAVGETLRLDAVAFDLLAPPAPDPIETTGTSR